MMEFDKSFEKHSKPEFSLKQWTSALEGAGEAQKIKPLT